MSPNPNRCPNESDRSESKPVNYIWLGSGKFTSSNSRFNIEIGRRLGGGWVFAMVYSVCVCVCRTNDVQMKQPNNTKLIIHQSIKSNKF